MLHDMGSHHPECPQRLTAINDHMIAQGIDAYFVYHDAPLATFEQLLRVHPASHLERLKRASPEHGVVHLDPDTAMNPHTWNAALRAAGAGCMAVDMVMSVSMKMLSAPFVRPVTTPKKRMPWASASSTTSGLRRVMH